MAATQERLIRAALEAGLTGVEQPLSPAQVSALVCYVALLQHWNRAYNLIATIDTETLVQRHIIDSLLVVPYLHGETVLDVGTGAGLPGIPLAIACPERRFGLLDSNGKRMRFLFQVTTALALPNVTRVETRVEDWQPASPVDTVISRAYAALGGFVQATAHCGHAGTRWLAMKSRCSDAELSEIEKPFIVAANHALPAPAALGERRLVVIRRTTTGTDT